MAAHCLKVGGLTEENRSHSVDPSPLAQLCQSWEEPPQSYESFLDKPFAIFQVLYTFDLS